ncbi:MAG TPA: glycosyltransferase family 2 protein [Gaiellales bacterium]|nr:glycosyltransferase family 2 protein [Gaiellales bacterium]
MSRSQDSHDARFLQALVVAFAIAVLSVTTVRIATITHDWILIVYWTLGASAIGGCLLAFIVGRRYTHLPVAEGRVLCIVPAYNEPPESLARTVDALLAQSVEIDIVVIDDGSVIPVVPSRTHPRVKWLRQENTGKRGAQVAVLRQIPRDEYQFLLTVDSDSQPFPDACGQLLRSMWDPHVQAATGMIYVRNYAESWVSRATDIDIGGSCVMMRASRSMLGALETTSGALALYRSSLLYDHLDAYAVECGTGDDRWLALRALRRGQVVAVAEARVETDMPATVRGTYRQRLRWARSWWWMLPYVFRYLRPRQFLSPLYGITQLVVTPFLLVYGVVVGTSLWLGQGDAASATVWLYAIDYLVIRYALAALYLLGRPAMSTRQKWVSFFVGTPGAIVLNLVLLSPTRYWALAKLFDNRWQTRQAPETAAELT